ncbi:MAG: tetratricopeptide repeat protein [bacterium]|nr:tetratricopeptide repeat protein [bacterium]MDY2650722.1 tetratricopeptide repeat protein [Candidatus Egerieousia sp.]
MRKFIVTILALSAMLSALVVAAQERPEDIWPKANDAYSLGEWKSALELYESIENKGVVSERLYYNMGNTHYKLGDNARAILYYERALKLNPANKDAANNIKIAQIHTLDKIEVLPEFVLVTWVRNMRDSLSSNSWAVAGLVLLVAVLVLLLLYRFAGSMGFRKFSFVAAILAFLLMAGAFAFSWSMRNNATDNSNAIVVSAVSNIKSSPDANGNNLFILHNGTKVEVLENVGKWMKIELADGRQGWIDSSTVEII